MIYIFLDFDGVTHPTSANGNYFRKENLEPLFNSIKDLDVKLVITSTWRLDKPLEWLKQSLGEIGESVIGVTPEINEPFARHIRQREVELYLSNNCLSDEDWIAIDDTAAFYHPDVSIVLIDGSIGFTDLDGDFLRNLIISTSH